jgi:hypothetical protein
MRTPRPAVRRRQPGKSFPSLPARQRMSGVQWYYPPCPQARSRWAVVLGAAPHSRGHCASASRSQGAHFLLDLVDSFNYSQRRRRYWICLVVFNHCLLSLAEVYLSFETRARLCHVPTAYAKCLTPSGGQGITLWWQSPISEIVEGRQPIHPFSPKSPGIVGTARIVE